MTTPIEREVEYTRNEKGEVEIDGITFKPHTPLREEFGQWCLNQGYVLGGGSFQETVDWWLAKLDQTVSLERKRIAEGKIDIANYRKNHKGLRFGQDLWNKMCARGHWNSPEANALFYIEDEDLLALLTQTK